VAFRQIPAILRQIHVALAHYSFFCSSLFCARLRAKFLLGTRGRCSQVCVGAFVLAEAGLLNGKNATAHWKFGQQLAKQYPRVKVQSNPLWVKDGNIYTSEGISAGIDLALAWVEEDCGAALAHEAARELVLFLRRPGGSSN
jgi:transcriptional regulator GlxA family with amidase domain